MQIIIKMKYPNYVKVVGITFYFFTPQKYNKVLKLPNKLTFLTFILKLIKKHLRYCIYQLLLLPLHHQTTINYYGKERLSRKGLEIKK